MNCDEISDLLSASLDGELTVQQEAEVQSHLAQCPSCRALMEDLTAIHEGCGGLETAPPPELTRRILEHLPPQKASKPTKIIYWKRWGAMAAAVCLIALAAWRIPGALDRGDTTQGVVSGDVENVSATASPDRSAPEAALPEDERPVSSPALSTYDTFTGGAGVANVAPTAEPDAVAPLTLGAPSAAAAQKSEVSNGDGGVNAAAAPAPSIQPSAKMASAEMVEAQTEISIQDRSFDQDALPEVTMFRASLTYDDTSDAGAEYAELPPAEGSGEESISIEPLEGLYRVASTASDASPAYCGVLTMAQGAPIGSYPVERQADGQLWYILPAADFNALLQELDAQSVSYDLRLTGLDISPTAQQGLLIIEG